MERVVEEGVGVDLDTVSLDSWDLKGVVAVLDSCGGPRPLTRPTNTYIRPLRPPRPPTSSPNDYTRPPTSPQLLGLTLFFFSGGSAFTISRYSWRVTP